jgi:hypothetical protein
MGSVYSYRPCQILLSLCVMACGGLISAGLLCLMRFQCRDDGWTYLLFGAIHGGIILVGVIVSGMIQCFCYRERKWDPCAELCEEV